MEYNFFILASSYIWPIIVTGFIIIIVGLLTLRTKNDKDYLILRFGSSVIFVLGLFGIIYGVYGYYSELFHAADKILWPGGSLPTVICTIITSEDTLEYIQHNYIRSSSVMMVCMTFTIITGLIWFGIQSKIFKDNLKRKSNFNLSDF